MNATDTARLRLVIARKNAASAYAQAAYDFTGANIDRRAFADAYVEACRRPNALSLSDFYRAYVAEVHA